VPKTAATKPFSLPHPLLANNGQGRRITYHPPTPTQHPPPTIAKENGKTKLQLSTVALAYMHGKFIKIEDNLHCKSVCQFVSLSPCQPVNPSVSQLVIQSVIQSVSQSADECLTRWLRGIKWGRDIPGNCNLASQSAR